MVKNKNKGKIKRLIKEFECKDRMSDGKLSNLILVVTSFGLIILLIILSIIW